MLCLSFSFNLHIFKNANGGKNDLLYCGKITELTVKKKKKKVRRVSATYQVSNFKIVLDHFEVISASFNCLTGSS